MNRRVFALTGRPGCGKSYVASQFREWSLPVVEYGEEMKHYYKQYNGCPDSTWEMAQALREHHGPAGPAVCAAGAISAAFISEDWIVLDGVRNTAELEFVSSAFNTATHLISVDVDYETRLERFYGRGDFDEHYDDTDVAMDVAEYRMNTRTQREEEVGLAYAIDSALHQIDNSGTKEETGIQVAHMLDEFEGR